MFSVRHHAACTYGFPLWSAVTSLGKLGTSLGVIIFWMSGSWIFLMSPVWIGGMVRTLAYQSMWSWHQIHTKLFGSHHFKMLFWLVKNCNSMQFGCKVPLHKVNIYRVIQNDFVWIFSYFLYYFWPTRKHGQLTMHPWHGFEVMTPRLVGQCPNHSPNLNRWHKDLQ